MKTIIVFLCFSVAVLAQDVLIIFSDSPDGDVLVDASWGYRTSPSYLELAGNNDKFPVDTETVFYGAHSLRLSWQSRAGGDWGVAIASRGWKAMDFTQYDSLVYWINAAEAISSADLPSIALEDMNDQKSVRLSLGELLGDVDGEQTIGSFMAEEVGGRPVVGDQVEWNGLTWTVAAMDVLVPRLGEIIGGSQREERRGVLERRMAECGLDPTDYWWYLDLRRYGTVPHAGFGLGVERTLAWICGIQHVRETIPFPRLLNRLTP